MKNILVIGGGGYVGTPLCELLQSSGMNVTALDIFWFGNHLSNSIHTFHWNMIDIFNGPFPIDLDEFDSVIFLACLSNDPSSEISPQFTRLVNYDATIEILKLIEASKVKRLIYASSSSVYGVKNEDQVTEDLGLEPLTLYSKLKVDVENFLKRNFLKTDYAIVRPATVFGPSPRLRLDVVANILSAHAFYNQRIKVFGGSQVRPNIYISDLCLFYETLLNYEKSLDGEVYNFGGKNLKVLELAEKVQEISEVFSNEAISMEILPTDDIRSYKINSDKAFNKFNLSSLTPLEVGLIELMKQLKTIDNWKASRFSNLNHLKEII